MSEEVVVDDSSHYEVSLTAGQAFVAFVLLLLSLAASFAFGLMIGKGQMDDRLVVRRTPAVVNEASVIPARKGDGRIVELGDTSDARRQHGMSRAEEPRVEEAEPVSLVVEPSREKPESAKLHDSVSHPSEPVRTAEPIHETPAVKSPAPAPVAQPKLVTPPQTTPSVVHDAQVLSTSDVKTAEALAAKLIDKGFTSAYVERTQSIRGTVYRVRVRFGSEAEARGAVEKLRGITGSEVWITK
ncbi:MAG TPA: SPOR domain-containing protein [Thermoanaerobaculia bacterium]|nr:SPOR domain-containing protein [Thermoanaerobaculia bacterium]